MKLSDLIQIKKYDFIKEYNDDSNFNILKIVNGFANSNNGGTLFIGVGDNEELYGISKETISPIIKKIDQLIHDHLSYVSYNINTIKYIKNYAYYYILQIIIDESAIKPVIVSYNDATSIFINKNGKIVGADQDDIIKLVLENNGNNKYDGLITNIKYDSNDFSDLYYDKNIVFTTNQLIRYGFINKNMELKNAALIFRNNHKLTSNIIINQYSSINFSKKKMEYVIESGSVSKVISTIKKIIYDIFNKKSESYPENALEEAIIYAYIYRDYLNKNPIFINLFNNRLEIIVPGKITEFIKENEVISNLSKIKLIQRNKNIQKLFNVFKYTSGNPFNKIKYDYRKTDESHKPYLVNYSNKYKIVLPNLANKTGTYPSKRTIVQYDDPIKSSRFDNDILYCCYYKPIRASEIAKLLGITYSSYLIKIILKNLVDNDLLKISINKNVTYYKTNSDLVSIEYNYINS